MCTQALAANGGCFCVSVREFLVSLKIGRTEGENKDVAKFNLWCLGAKVYITGRRQEILENAATTHSPQDGGEIIP